VFDRIACPLAPSLASTAFEVQEWCTLAADVQYLLGKGAIFAPEMKGNLSLPAKAQAEWEESSRRLDQVVESIVKSRDLKGVNANSIRNEANRLLAIQLREVDGLNAVFLEPSS
jgi:hypothetical protein